MRGATRGAHLDAPFGVGLGSSGTYGPEDHSKCRRGRQWRRHIRRGNNDRRIHRLDGDVVISAIGADGPLFVIAPVHAQRPAGREGCSTVIVKLGQCLLNSGFRDGDTFVPRHRSKNGLVLIGSQREITAERNADHCRREQTHQEDAALVLRFYLYLH